MWILPSSVIVTANQQSYFPADEYNPKTIDSKCNSDSVAYNFVAPQTRSIVHFSLLDPSLFGPVPSERKSPIPAALTRAPPIETFLLSAWQ